MGWAMQSQLTWSYKSFQRLGFPLFPAPISYIKRSCLSPCLVASPSSFIFSGFICSGMIVLLWCVYRFFLKKLKKREANLQSKDVQRKEMAWFALKVGYINDKIGDSPCLSNLFILIMASNKSLQIVLNLSCLLIFWFLFFFLLFIS